MDGPSVGRRTKGALVEIALAGLPRYQKALALDLLYGTVAVQPAWLSRPLEELIALEHDCLLEPPRVRALEHLLDRVAHLCGTVVPTLIEQEVRWRRGGGLRLTRLEVDSLRRGRGPRAVRDVLFEELDTWPDSIPTHLVAPVRAALDEVLGERRRQRSAPSRAREATGLVESCREVVEEFARRRRLSHGARGWLLSEVVDQLYRNADRGRLPDNLRAWTLATAKIKWRTRSTHSRGGEPPHEHDRPGGDGIGDAVAAQHDLQRVLRAAGGDLKRRADLLARLGDAERVNTVAHRVAADILSGADIDRVLAVVEGASEGAQDLSDELATAGLAASTDRTAAVHRLIGDALRDAWRQAHDPGIEASS